MKNFESPITANRNRNEAGSSNSWDTWTLYLSPTVRITINMKNTYSGLPISLTFNIYNIPIIQTKSCSLTSVEYYFCPWFLKLADYCPLEVWKIEIPLHCPEVTKFFFYLFVYLFYLQVKRSIKKNSAIYSYTKFTCCWKMEF